jgi:hypothetical protein
MKQIPLTKGKFAIVDDEDFEFLSQWKWCAACGGKYAGRYETINGKRTGILMHRVIAKTPLGMDTDHINMDKLDNRKINLRVCTRRQNLMNKKSEPNSTSKFRGVFLNKKLNKWSAQIKVEGKRTHLGTFKNEEDAAQAYNFVAFEHFGEFARLNIVEAR